VGISVVVEKVVCRQFSGINRQAGEIFRTGNLVEAVGDELLLATESYRLLQIEPRYIEFWYMLSGLLRFAIGEAGKAESVSEAEALVELRVEV
jgi:hypothetical protein